MTSQSMEFGECVNAVASRNRSHLSYEQSNVWPRLADVLTKDELDAAARRWSSARHAAPTRPHPHLPADPRLLTTAGAVLGRLDRTRDAVRGSGGTASVSAADAR